MYTLHYMTPLLRVVPAGAGSAISIIAAAVRKGLFLELPMGEDGSCDVHTHAACALCRVAMDMLWWLEKAVFRAPPISCTCLLPALERQPLEALHH